MCISARLRTALYAQVSSGCQPRDGIASQLAARRQRSAADGCVVAEERCFLDADQSGSTLRRPALPRLREQVSVGGMDRLYVYSPDRLSRNFAHQARLVEEFRRGGVAVVFPKQSYGELS